MKYFRTCVWVWLISVLFTEGYYVLGTCMSLFSLVHHRYFGYSKKYQIGVSVLLLVIGLRIISRPYFSILEEKDRYIGTIEEIKEYGAIVRIDGFKKVLVYEIDADLGDKVEIEGKVSTIDSLHNRGLFDYQKYMNQRGIYQCINPETISIIKKGSSLHAFLYRYIQSLPINRIANRFLYGIDENEPYAIFFSTGMHFSFLIYHLTKLLSFYLDNKKIHWIEVILSIFLLACFPMEFSLLRICLYRVVRCFKQSSLTTLSISSLALLFLQPNCGNQLSFVIPFLLSLSNQFMKSYPSFIRTKVVLLPIQLLTQYELNLFWLLFFSTLKTLFSITFLSVILSIFLPISISFWFTQVLYDFSILIWDILSHFFNLAIVGKMSIGLCVLYYIGIYGIYESRVGGLCILLSIALFFITIYATPWIQVTFLDVGQGDCMIVEYPFHQGVVMVDTGGGMRENLAKNVLLPYLKSRGIRKLDALIISHHDIDHDGASEELLSAIPITYNIDYDNAPSLLKINAYTIYFLDCIRHGEDENALSLVTLFDFKRHTLLSAGDLNKENEEQLLKEYPKLQIDFYKLSHHGSASSSSLRYLSKLSPKLVFNSSGRNNRYHHPSYDVEEILKRLQIPLYDTQTRGSIHLVLFNQFSLIYTAID